MRQLLSRPVLLWLGLAALALVAFALALMSGSVAVSPGNIARALTGAGGEQADIVLRLRLPRWRRLGWAARSRWPAP
jgi:ABC-type enterobactin transport system permease subunit